MILTVTPSPAIDWTIAVDSFELDAANRITTSTRQASGQGLDVSLALHRAQVATTAVFPGGGRGGEIIDASLAEAGIPFVRVDTGCEVRTEITLVSLEHSTQISEPDVALESKHVAEFIRRVVEAAAETRAVVISGSVAPSMGAGKLYELIDRLHPTGAQIVVDTSGEPLALAVAAGPDLIKPNVHELADLASRDLRTFADVVSASREMVARGVGSVLASLGADGAMYVDERLALLATARDIPVVDSAGAGDALLAGFVAVDAEPAERLRQAVLWASSAVAQESTCFPIRPEFEERITVEEFAGGDAPLSEPALPFAAASPSSS